MISSPTVSVVIPLYNHERYIREAIMSVLIQSCAPIEVIVIDDGSTDDSLSVVAEIAATDPRIIYWSQVNQDAPQTINNGIRRACGDIVAVLNSDDVYHPERLKHCVQLLSNEPEISAVFTGLTFIDSSSEPTNCEGFERLLEFYRESGDLALSLFNGNFFVTTSNLVIRRSIFDEIGYFSELRYAHDLDFYMRVIRAGKQIKILETSLLRYRIHGANTIRENRDRAFVEVSAIAASHAHFLLDAHQDGNSRWDELDRLLKICDRQGISLCMLILLWYLQRLSPKPTDSSYFLNDTQLAGYIDDRMCRDIADRAAIDEMKHSIHIFKNQLAEMELELDLSERKIVALESSTSWKVTRPLRWLASIIKGQKSERSS